VSDEKLWDESPTSRHLQVLYHQTSFQNRLSICRLKSEQNYSEKEAPEKGHSMDDALKTRGIIYLNVETWLLSARPYLNF